MSEDAERMLLLFAGLERAHGTHGDMVRNPDKAGKMEIHGSAKTLPGGPTLELWEDHLAGDQYLGVIPIRDDGTVMWGCIDVDRYDLDHAAMVRQLSEAKLPLIVCRTKSGGAHLYIFLAEPVRAADVQSKLRDLAARLGYGGSEIFPKQTHLLAQAGDTGNWLNMPYHGSDRTTRYAIGENGKGLTLRQFLARAEAARLTAEEFETLRASTSEERSEFADGPPCLEHLVQVGFPEGTRNNAMVAIVTFLKKKYPDRWEEMAQEWSQRYFSPPRPMDEVMDLIGRMRSKEYKYKCSDQPICSFCNAALCRTRRYGVGVKGTLPVIDSLAVLNTDQPIWFLDVGGSRIELSTDELLIPSRFQKKCMETIHVVVPVLKKSDWDAIIAGLRENMTIIEAPPEASLSGQFFEHLETFCTDRHAARVVDEIILGKAWHDEPSGRVYFRLRDLQDYLERVRFRELTRSQMTNRLRDMGGGPHFFNLKGKGVNVFWVPATSFSVQSEAHDLPDIQEDVL